MPVPRSSFLLLLILLVTALVITAAASSAAQAGPAADEAVLPWSYHTVADAGDTGEYPSLVLDDEGDAHISFYRAEDEHLYYAAEQDGKWTILRMDPTAASIGKFSSLALDADGYAHISYYDEANHMLKYTHTTSSGFVTPVEYVTGGLDESDTSLALDKNGRPIIAYYDYVAGSLMITYKDAGGSWQQETVDGGDDDVGINPSMVLDDDGYPHISYYDATNQNLKYVAKDANGWQTPQVVNHSGSAGYSSSLALDHLGKPSISYWDWGQKDLKFATLSPDYGWRSTTIQSAGSVGQYNSLALDRSGLPHISYSDESSGDLKYIYMTSSGNWSQAHIVDSRGDTGIDNDLVLDSQGSPHIAYYDGSGKDLEYALLLHVTVGLAGNTACEWGERTCNPCVADVVGSFNRLRTNGEVLGFNTAPGHPVPEYGTATFYSNHWQGAQRLMPGGGQAFTVSIDEAFNGQAVFSTANMSSRTAGGERWRSNRLAWNTDVSKTQPAAADRIYDTQIMPSKGSHPGGIQAMGDFLAVGAGSQFYIYDMQKPFQPQQVGGYFDRGSKSSSTSAMAQLHDQSYLVAISSSNASSIDFYRSSTANPADRPHVPDPESLEHIDEWKPEDEGWSGALKPFYWDAFQSINLVSDCTNGALYLIGTGNHDATSRGAVPGFPPWPNGEDRAYLYAIKQQGDEIGLDYVSSRHFTCSQRGTTYCNFDAAAGIYVDDKHQLYLYSTEHRADGPGKSVKMMEFRPLPHSSCATTDDGWVELFEGPGYNGRSLMIDWIDRDKENYENYDKVEDFEDKAASAAWCLPHDWTAILYEDKEPCGGKEISLRGSGAFRQTTLRQFGGNGVSCSRFFFDPPRQEVYKPALGITLVYIPPTPSAQAAAAAAQERSTTVTIPPGALDQELTITLDPQAPPGHDTAPLAFAGTGFTLAAADGSTPLSSLTFAKPANVNIQVSDDDLDGLDKTTLALYYWDELAAEWTDASKTCTPAGPKPGDVCKTGEYALLAEPQPRRVLVDEMHENLLSLNWQRAQQIANTIGYAAEPEWFYLDELHDQLAAEFDLQRVASGKLTAARLEDVDVLLIPPYREAMTPHEVNLIKRYVAGGGGLIMLGSAGYTAADEELAASYGIKHVPLALFGPAPQDEANLTLTQFGGHPALSGVEEMTVSWGQPLSISGQAARLAQTPPDTWLDVNDNAAYDEGTDPLAAFFASAAQDTGCGRVIVLGDDAYSDGDLSWTANDQAMAAMLRWAAGGRPCALDKPLQPLNVLVDESHENKLTLDWNRAVAKAEQAGEPAQPGWYHLGRLQEILAADFHLAQSEGEPLTAALLSQYEALLISPNDRALSPAEQTAVKQYIAGGGGLLLLGDCGFEDPNPALAAAFGIRFDQACLYAPVGDSEPVFQAGNYADLAWLRGTDPMTMLFGQSLALSGSAVTLLDTLGLDAWRDDNSSGAYDSGESGIFKLAAGVDTGCGRVAAVADDAFCDDCLDMAQRWENDVLMRALLRWLTAGSDCQSGPSDYAVFLPMLKR